MELPFSALPKRMPFGTSVFQKNGIRASRRCCGVARQSCLRRTSASAMPALLASISFGSMPVNRSCQRTPSEVKSTICLVPCCDASSCVAKISAMAAAVGKKVLRFIVPLPIMNVHPARDISVGLLDAGKRFDPLEHAIMKVSPLRTGLKRWAGELHRDDAFRPYSKIDILDRPQASDRKAGAVRQAGSRRQSRAPVQLARLPQSRGSFREFAQICVVLPR